MRKILSMNKKGVLGLDTAKAVMIALLVLSVLAIAVFLALVSLRDSGIFTSGGTDYNRSLTVINYTIDGTTNFFKQVPTFFTLIAVVVLILIIAIVIVAVSRFQTGGSRGESL